MMKFLRRFGDLGINGAAAQWYDENSRNHRTEEMRECAREIASHIHDGNSVLEIAPGPGYLSIELAKLGRYEIAGLDISEDFVEVARRNAKQAGVQIDFRKGNISSIPFPDDSFDFIVCTAAFKNFKEPLKALCEMYRALKPSATAMIVDMNRSSSNRDLEALTQGVKGFDALFLKLSFKYFLRKGAYTKAEMVDIASKTQFKGYDVKETELRFSLTSKRDH